MNFTSPRGDQNAQIALSQQLQRFYVVDINGCWLWQLYRNKKGYGYYRLNREGKNVLAHKWFYEQFKSIVPFGMEVHHKCKIKACVNPDHLELIEKLEHSKMENPKLNRTQCIRGHPLEGKNIYINKEGRKFCQACRRLSRNGILPAKGRY